MLKGLYYCTSDVFILETMPLHKVCYMQREHREDYEDNEGHGSVLEAQVDMTLVPTPKLAPCCPAAPTSVEKQLEAELWSARLGFPSN